MFDAVSSACRSFSAAGKAFLLLLVVPLILGAGPAPSPREMPSPAMMVTRFHEALVKAVKTASGQGFTARKSAFMPVVAASYDTQFMARIAAGSYWDRLSGGEREALAAALTDLTVANYAARFRDYNGQQFAVLEAQPASQGRVLVRAQIKRRAGEPVKLSYLLEKSAKPQGWSIIDVWLNDTVSELALRRSEFSRVLRDKGGAALIADLRSKIAALPKDDAPGMTRMN